MMTRTAESVVRDRVTALLLFVALATSYASLSAGSIAGQGYTGEEIESGLSMLARTTAWIKGHPMPPMIWSRHGPLPVLFDLPFLKLGKLIISPDFMLSFSPALFTAGLVTILFLWLRKFCSPAMSSFLSLAAAFGTMLWPYAYIGLETKQSFFLFLAGYLVLADGKIHTWPRILLFATASALAISVKTTGILLAPAVVYLGFVQFRGNWHSQRAKILASLLIVMSIWGISHWGTNAFWVLRGGGASSLKPWLVDSSLSIFINLVGLFGSPTKGLFVYAPLLIASLYAVPRTYRTRPKLTIYAALVTACALSLLVLLKYPADEVWGSRYLHIAIAPLTLCIGAAWPRFRWRREGSILMALALVGLVISFLGAFYYYGVRDSAMAEASQNTMERIAGDNDWNHIMFDARLFQVWRANNSGAPVLWTPQHTWVWAPPADAPPWKTINLTSYCAPQSFLVRFWHTPKQGRVEAIFAVYVSCLVAGVLLLGLVMWRMVREQPAWVVEGKDRTCEAV